MKPRSKQKQAMTSDRVDSMLILSCALSAHTHTQFEMVWSPLIKEKFGGKVEKKGELSAVRGHG